MFETDFEKRNIEAARNATYDIADCDRADVDVIWSHGVPLLRFIFGHPQLRGRPSLAVQLVSESRKNPLAPGKAIEGDKLKRHVRESVETYLKANGIEITRKVFENASL
jgi:hypothetical protein